MLDVKQLRVLKEVAEQGSFSAAAESLSYTQPAISQQIAALERRAGATLVDRTSRGVRLTDAGRALVEGSLSRGVAGMVSPTEVEAIRGRIAALPAVPARARLNGSDLLAALAIFLLVVLATFPVVLPFAVMQDVGMANNASRVIALVMLFLGGLGLGHYAGYGSWRAGLMMTALGVLLVGAIKVLGG